MSTAAPGSTGRRPRRRARIGLGLVLLAGLALPIVSAAPASAASYDVTIRVDITAPGGSNARFEEFRSEDTKCMTFPKPFSKTVPDSGQLRLEFTVSINNGGPCVSTPSAGIFDIAVTDKADRNRASALFYFAQEAPHAFATACSYRMSSKCGGDRGIFTLTNWFKTDF